MALNKQHEEAAKQFHEEHPEVLKKAIKFARQEKAEGAKRLSTALLYERVRADLKISLSNNYKPYYARLIKEQCPDLDPLIEVKGD